MNSFMPVPVSYMGTPATQQEILFASQKTETASACVGKIPSCSGSTADSWKAGRRREISGGYNAGHLFLLGPTSSIIPAWRISNFCTPSFSYLLPAFPTNSGSSSLSSLLSYLIYLPFPACQVASKRAELHTVPTGGRNTSKARVSSSGKQVSAPAFTQNCNCFLLPRSQSLCQQRQPLHHVIRHWQSAASTAVYCASSLS